MNWSWRRRSPPVGTPLGTFEELDNETGDLVRVPLDATMTLILLVSPHCSLCKETLRGLRGATSKLDVATVVISDGNREEAAPLRDLLKGRVPFITSLQRQRMLGVTTIPFGIVTSREGVVVAQGVVNGSDELDDLLERASQRPSPPVFTATVLEGS
jgi:hypothetical protein